MAEIKSTVDLVMEKIGKLEITPEERERFRQEEVEDLAQRLLNRYFVQGDQKDLSTLKKELQGAREDVKKALTELLISTYSLEDPSTTILEGLEILLKGKGKDIVKALRELTSSYQKEREKGYQKMEKELREELARKGISGTAVEPNLDSSPGWADFTDRLDKEYRGRVKGIFTKS
ncbi:MAG: hypothetical protein JRI46_08795 [Deltaproteobacteria bacterium]|nr:hypothetical protein [Deltaproteobacteria bacterium]